MKVVVQFKGREMQHKELGRDLLQKIFTPIEDIAAMESAPKVPSRDFFFSFLLSSFLLSLPFLFSSLVVSNDVKSSSPIFLVYSG